MKKKPCNCKLKPKCPFNVNYLQTNVAYQDTVRLKKKRKHTQKHMLV